MTASKLAGKSQRGTQRANSSAKHPPPAAQQNVAPSIPYTMAPPILQERVIAFLPKLAIKPDSFWVGILAHTIRSLDSIKDQASFLWLKCHAQISVRTLKFQYFRRHPLEDFELKHLDYYPDERTQVRELWERCPYRDPRVLILRAIEDDYRDTADKLDRADIKLAKKHGRSIRGFQAQHPGQQPPMDQLLELNNDDCASAFDAEDHSDRNTSTRKRRQVSREPDNESDDESESEDEDEGGSDNESGKDNSDGESQDQSEESDDESASVEQLGKLDAFPHGLRQRLQTIGSSNKKALEQILNHTYQTCSVDRCGKRFALQPWTRFTTRNKTFKALCTAHSLGIVNRSMKTSGNQTKIHSELAVMQQQIEVQAAKKIKLQVHGSPQNMADDAPLNHAKALPAPFSNGDGPSDAPMIDEGFEVARLPADYDIQADAMGEQQDSSHRLAAGSSDGVAGQYENQPFPHFLAARSSSSVPTHPASAIQQDLGVLRHTFPAESQAYGKSPQQMMGGSWLTGVYPRNMPKQNYATSANRASCSSPSPHTQQRNLYVPQSRQYGNKFTSVNTPQQQHHQAYSGPAVQRSVTPFNDSRSSQSLQRQQQAAHSFDQHSALKQQTSAMMGYPSHNQQSRQQTNCDFGLQSPQPIHGTQNSHASPRTQPNDMHRQQLGQFLHQRMGRSQFNNGMQQRIQHQNQSAFQEPTHPVMQSSPSYQQEQANRQPLDHPSSATVVQNDNTDGSSSAALPVQAPTPRPPTWSQDDDEQTWPQPFPTSNNFANPDMLTLSQPAPIPESWRPTSALGNHPNTGQTTWDNPDADAANTFAVPDRTPSTAASPKRTLRTFACAGPNGAMADGTQYLPDHFSTEDDEEEEDDDTAEDAEMEENAELHHDTHMGGTEGYDSGDDEWALSESEEE